MKHIRTSIIVTIFWTIVAGGLYPLFVYGVGALVFPGQSRGSVVVKNGKVVGSSLIGQDFAGPRYFHPRPSAIGYDASSSGASNKGWTSADLKKDYERRKAAWVKSEAADEPPMDMLFASGSGLDPHVSPEAAEQQVPGVAAARHLTREKASALLELVRAGEEEPQLGFLGERRVNVLLLNLALDERFPEAVP